MKKRTTFAVCMSALFAAVTAILAQIVIPIGPVPITLATFAVFLTGALLGAKLGAVSQAVYVFLGAVGIPVFNSFKGGLGVLLGPTGGYLAGYILAAWLVGLLAKRSGNRMLILPLSMLAGYFAYTILGTCWYMFLTNTGLVSALMVCVVPFILGDALKITLATFLVCRLKPILQSYLDDLK